MDLRNWNDLPWLIIPFRLERKLVSNVWCIFFDCSRAESVLDRDPTDRVPQSQYVLRCLAGEPFNSR